MKVDTMVAHSKKKHKIPFDQKTIHLQRIDISGSTSSFYSPGNFSFPDQVITASEGHTTLDPPHPGLSGIIQLPCSPRKVRRPTHHQLSCVQLRLIKYILLLPSSYVLAHFRPREIYT